MTWVPSIAAAVIIAWAILGKAADWIDGGDETIPRRDQTRDTYLEWARTAPPESLGDVPAVSSAEAIVQAAWRDTHHHP
ncbi:hypothetical protein AB0958_19170 [Streptomyces sp. NPDC006655]|uniref:hypothetical protein n=1 Tax=Streptomyces sp. NPDC006655 TaxID=3156898 RepID=UPI003455057B